MRGDQFEKVFGEFLESEAYEEAEGALFDFARAAYQAGWLAAGGVAGRRRRTSRAKKGGALSPQSRNIKTGPGEISGAGLH